MRPPRRSGTTGLPMGNSVQSGAAELSAGALTGRSRQRPSTSCSAAKCGGYFDMRDLAQVFEHEGPLPHPFPDKPQ
jgi:hypothetical protein